MEQINQFLQSLSTTIGGLLPGVLGTLLVLIIGMMIAKGFGRLITFILKKAKLDERVHKLSGSSFKLELALGKIAYYFAMVYVLLLVLEMMGVHNVLQPLESMLEEFFAFIPNFIAALIIGFAGYIIAKIASEAVGAVSTAIESFATKYKLGESINLTKVVKQLVFLFVFIPILVVAIEAIQLKALSEPATKMLSDLMLAIPNIIGGALIIAVSYIVGKYVVAILVELMHNLKVDELPAKLKLTEVLGKASLTKTLGNVVFFFIMFAAIVAALEKLDLSNIAIILNDVLVIAGQIFFGLVILVLGNSIAQLAYKSLAKNESSKDLAGLARVAILGLFVAIALRSMGIADEIVNLAFGLTLGAVAVAVALSFGLGGKEAAGKQMEYILSRFRKEDKKLEE